MFLVFFRQSFASVGFVAMEAKALEVNELVEITGLFKHDK